MKGLITYIVIMLVGLMGFGFSAHAASVSAKMRVYARVAPMVSVEFVRHPGVLNITERDIERGYVEAPGATVLRIRTNSSYAIYFEHEDGDVEVVEEVEVFSGADRARLDSHAVMYEPYRGVTGAVTKVISYRLYLDEDAEPGVYPWPVMVVVEAE